jgi:hypothetical protein
MKFENEFLIFDTKKSYFEITADECDLTRYLKLAYSNSKIDFYEKFILLFESYFKANNIEYYNDILYNIESMWDIVTPFSFEDAFNIKNDQLRIKVFSSFNIEEVINKLGTNRIKTEGKETINKVWNEITNEFENVPVTLIYELHHVNGTKLNVEDEVLPVVRCWCTSTNQEHWLWVDPSKIIDNSPLSAIASTCCVYESMMGKIKHIIRHGDVFIFEMLEEIIPDENDKVISLSVEDYFSLLKSQS